MGFKCSLPCSLAHAIASNSESDKTRSYLIDLSLRLLLILSSHLRPGLSSGPFPLAYPIEIVYTYLILKNYSHISFDKSL
jgi:hypothetical protein